jgi:L-ascorbate metabolism protein UlaG (beta-lactamase superfamily)
MKIRLIRHATLLLEYAGKKILVDPMFADQGAYAGLPTRGNNKSNPLVPLPFPFEELGRPDLILITHLHFDHLDKKAAARLPRGVPVVCRRGDDGHIRNQMFETVLPCARKPVTAAGIEFIRTDARHGRGWVGMLMGRPCGFVLRAPGEPVLYLSGDTVFFSGVTKTLRAYRPDVVVANAGAARFMIGAPVTMDARDVVTLALTIPRAGIVAVHMEAVNHCGLSRRELADEARRAGVADRVHIPADGEELEFQRMGEQNER